MPIILHLTERRKILVTNNIQLEKHEWETIKRLLGYGYQIELIPKSNLKNVHTADLLLDGEEWEMKSPRGKGKYIYQNIIQRGAKQARNIIIDLHRFDVSKEKALAGFRKEFLISKGLKKMIVITKKNERVVFEK